MAILSESFISWEAAFDACRECNQPIIVKVEGETAKVFPSGHAKTLSHDGHQPDHAPGYPD